MTTTIEPMQTEASRTTRFLALDTTRRCQAQCGHGSWARASGRKGEPPTVHQAGPRRLWDVLDGIRHDWVSDGSLPVYGAAVTVTPDGRTRLFRRGWDVTVG